MKIRYTHPQTRDSITEQAEFTTEHSSSSYGHPVLVADSGLFDPFQWVALNATLIEATAEERRLFKTWLNPRA